MLRGLCIALMAYSTLSLGLPSALLQGCVTQDMHFKQGEVILHTAHNQVAQLYLFHNVSRDYLWLNHEKWNPDLSAGWGSSLKAGHWSALMVSQPAFHLTCARLLGEKLQNIACDRSVKVCRLPAFHSTEASDENATFWAAEDQEYSALLQQLMARGITLQP